MPSLWENLQADRTSGTPCPYPWVHPWVDSPQILFPRINAQPMQSQSFSLSLAPMTGGNVTFNPGLVD